MERAIKLVRDRCRIEQISDGQPTLIVVYALDRQLPSGVRSVFVPKFRELLAQDDHNMYSVDLFDEFIKIHLPLGSRVEIVEDALSEAVQKLENMEFPEKSRLEKPELNSYLEKSNY